MHCGAEVTESSTNKQHHHTSTAVGLYFFKKNAPLPSPTSFDLKRGQPWDISQLSVSKVNCYATHSLPPSLSISPSPALLKVTTSVMGNFLMKLSLPPSLSFSHSGGEPHVIPVSVHLIFNFNFPFYYLFLKEQIKDIIIMCNQIKKINFYLKKSSSCVLPVSVQLIFIIV
jgi:hypothetical protein